MPALGISHRARRCLPPPPPAYCPPHGEPTSLPPHSGPCSVRVPSGPIPSASIQASGASSAPQRAPRPRSCPPPQPNGPPPRRAVPPQAPSPSAPRRPSEAPYSQPHNLYLGLILLNPTAALQAPPPQAHSLHLGLLSPAPSPRPDSLRLSPPPPHPPGGSGPALRSEARIGSARRHRAHLRPAGGRADGRAAGAAQPRAGRGRTRPGGCGWRRSAHSTGTRRR